MFAGVGSPGFGLGKFVHAFAEGRLEDDRKAAVEPLDLFQAVRLKAGGKIDAERGGAFISEALVISPLDGVPIGRGDTKVLRQQRVIFRDHAHVLVAGRDQHPAVQAVPPSKIDERRHALGVVGAGPGEATRDVTRISRDRMIGHEPDRNPMAAEAARDGDADMRAADNQRARRRARLKAIERGGFRRLCMHKIHGYSRLAAIDPAGSAKAWRRRSADRGAPRSAARVRRRAANPAPAIKRNSGPKLATAEAPAKCSPRTLDSKPPLRTGKPPWRTILARTSGASKLILSTSMR